MARRHFAARLVSPDLVALIGTLIKTPNLKSKLIVRFVLPSSSQRKAEDAAHLNADEFSKLI